MTSLQRLSITNMSDDDDINDESEDDGLLSPSRTPIVTSIKKQLSRRRTTSTTQHNIINDESDDDDIDLDLNSTQTGEKDENTNNQNKEQQQQQQIPLQNNKKKRDKSSSLSTSSVKIKMKRKANSTEYTSTISSDDEQETDDDDDEHDDNDGNPTKVKNQMDIINQEKEHNQKITKFSVILCCLALSAVIIVALIVIWFNNIDLTNNSNDDPTLTLKTPTPTIPPTFNYSVINNTIFTPNTSIQSTLSSTTFTTTSTSTATAESAIEPTFNLSAINTTIFTANSSIESTVSSTTFTTTSTSTSTSQTADRSSTNSTNETVTTSMESTLFPSFEPTTEPTLNPTSSPINMILQDGNTLINKGIIMTFPSNSFPDSLITINITEADDRMKLIYDESVIDAFNAIPIDNITNNYFLFHVEHDPLEIDSSIQYTFTIPIPTDLLDECRDDFGYEIFTYNEQIGFGGEISPLFVLMPSTFNDIENTLTTRLYPTMWINKTADLLISCTPGTNIISTNNRRRRVLLSDIDMNECDITSPSESCAASPIICPIPFRELHDDNCEVLMPFDITNHVGVDYKANNAKILAVADGIIQRSEYSQIYGEIIILRHHDDSATVYKNLRRRFVEVEQMVNVGDEIGLSFRGRANSPSHIHLEYIPNGVIYGTKTYIDANECILTESVLETGSIEVQDSGTTFDDAFMIEIDGYFVCKTETDIVNNCVVNNLRFGQHLLTLTVIKAPDGYGTYQVKLNDGWTFDDGSTLKNNWIDNDNHDDKKRERVGYTISWIFNVPCNQTISP